MTSLSPVRSFFPALFGALGARVFLGILTASPCLLAPSRADAAPPWVERGLTLPRHDWAFDLGLGIGHADFDQGHTGVGMNLEGAVGITRDFELGFRTGIRFGDEGRITQADEYGRLFDRQTFGTYFDVVADPEVRFRGRLVEGRVFELALEGRAYLPIEAGSFFGAQFGVPMAFHFGHRVRLDTGAYVPVLFEHQTQTWISLPVDVWIQATDRIWLGPMTGLRFHTTPRDDRFGRNDVAVSAGFGFGYQITHAVDFKAMVLFPRINESAGARNVGLGAGVQLRIE